MSFVAALLSNILFEAFFSTPKTFGSISGVIFSLVIPPLYESCQDQIDDKLILAHNIILSKYKIIDDTILKKIYVPLNKEKKFQ